MTDPMRSLMVTAIAEDEAVAAASWRKWRASTDLLRAPWGQLQILPLIPRQRLQSLLAGDAEADRLNGIVRRAWTEAQLQLATLVGSATCIARTGCVVAAFGATGIHLRLDRSGSIRPLTDLRVLIARDDLTTAVSALQTAGWKLHDAMPATGTLDWQTHIALIRGKTFLHLHWRALDVPAPLAAANEREFLSSLQSAHHPYDALRLLVPAHELLIALSDCRTAAPDGGIPWQLDVALLAPHIKNWSRWSSLAAKFQPTALVSIVELRAYGIAIPQLPAPRPPSVFFQRLKNALRWRGRRLRRRLVGVLRLSERSPMTHILFFTPVLPCHTGHGSAIRAGIALQILSEKTPRHRHPVGSLADIRRHG